MGVPGRDFRPCLYRLGRSEMDVQKAVEAELNTQLERISIERGDSVTG